jgi:hypothetical protein
VPESAVLLGLCLLFAAFAGGFIIGFRSAIASLLVGADRDDRTPHHLNGRFYYLVPEPEYCEMRLWRYRPPREECQCRN